MAEPMLIHLAGGRALEVRCDGPEDGVVVFLAHPTPSAGLLFEDWVRAASRRGLRLVSHSRPGYGASTPRPGRQVAEAAADVAAIADALGVERFHVLGWSGGGPHALACGALMPSRTISLAVVSGVAPRDAEGLDWEAGMSGANLEELAAAEAGPEELEVHLEGEREQLLQATGADVGAALGELLAPVDGRALTVDFADHLAAGAGAGLAAGVRGWLDDDLSFSAPWGFDPAAVGCPAGIWHGGQDRFVPVAHGRWLAARIPDAASHIVEAAGHLSLVLDGFGEVLDGLLAD